MKRIMILAVAVLGLLSMSSVVEACCGKLRGCGGGGGHHLRQKSCSSCGGHAGLFHRCKQQTTCQPTATVAYQTAYSYQPQQMVYSTTAPPPVTYAAPQVPPKSTPQMIPPPQQPVQPLPPGKSTPQMIPPPQPPVTIPLPPGKSTPQR